MQAVRPVRVGRGNTAGIADEIGIRLDQLLALISIESSPPRGILARQSLGFPARGVWAEPHVLRLQVRVDATQDGVGFGGLLPGGLARVRREGTAACAGVVIDVWIALGVVRARIRLRRLRG